MTQVGQTRLVEMLTDVSRPEDGNRAARKARDRDHLAMASPDAQTIDPLRAFLASPRRNEWLAYDTMKVYVRKSNRMLPASREPVRCLDIANIQVEPEVQNTGIFSVWLKDALEQALLADISAVMIENVLTERFADFFRRQGWQEIPNESQSHFFQPLCQIEDLYDVSDEQDATHPRSPR